MSQYFAQLEAERLQLRVVEDEKLLKYCLSVLEEHCTAYSELDILCLIADLRKRLEINSGELE